MKDSRKVYLEVMRIAAVLLVIFNHTDGFFFYTQTDNILTWFVSLGMACICRSAVPLFFMISGALLLGRRETLRELYQKRIARIVIVLVSFSLGYYLFDVWRYGTVGAGVNDFLQKLSSNGIRESFWFLYCYASALLLLPFFQMAAAGLNSKLMKYIFVVKLFFAVALPLLGLFSGITLQLDSGFLGDYVFYMILGYWLDKHEISSKYNKTWINITVIVVLTLINMGLVQMDFAIHGVYRQSLLDIFVCIFAIAIWNLCKRISVKWLYDVRVSRVVSTIGSCVFGIYLFDNFVRWQLLPFYLFLCEKTVGVFACAVYVLATFCLSFIYTYLSRKIPVIKNFL